MNPRSSTERSGDTTSSPLPATPNRAAAPVSRLLLAASVLGATGIGLGAFGAHGLQTILAERGSVDAWETAVQYHLLHAVALIALAALHQRDNMATAAAILWAGRCWLAGVLLFSGSLYALALGGPRWLGPVTPFGGLALIAGWLLVATVALRKST